MNALLDRVSWLHRGLAIVLATTMLAACGGGSDEDDAASVDGKADASMRFEAQGEDDDESGLELVSQGEEAEALAAGTAAVAELPNGGSIVGSIGVGQTVTHTFSARTGEGVQLRLVDTGGNAFFPRIQVFGPTGALVTSAQSDISANLAFAASASGAYSVVVADATGLNAGNYELHYVRAPGAREGGRLRNGGTKTATLTLGDLDSYTFRARTGEGIQLRLTDINATGLFPRLVVYAPNGALVTSAQSDSVAVLAFAASASGTYTVVATDATGTATGTYELRYTRAPGANEEGALVNGGVRTQTMTLGDLDSYTFMAQAGEGVQLRLVDVAATDFFPRLVVYGPNGALVTSAQSPDVAVLAFTASSSGTYTVIATDATGTGTGDYELHYVRGTGANEHGPLIDDGVRNETITRGDLDSFTFTGSIGNVVQLRLTDLDGGDFFPRLVVYGPTGALVTSAQSGDVAIVSFTLSVAGTYTVVATDAVGTGTGPYTLGYINSGQ